MFSRVRRRLAGEAGISLVEVLISTLVISFALGGLAHGIAGAFKGVGHSERRVYAAQLASETIEEIHALNWDVIGFYSSDPGYQAQDPAGRPTVTLDLPGGGVTPPTSGRPLPLQTASWKGTTFTVRTWISEDDAEVSRKRLEVEVSWPTPVQQGNTVVQVTRSVTATSLRAWPPVQRGPSQFYLVTAAAGVSQQLIDEYGYPLAPVSLAAVTNRAAASVTALWAHRDGGNRSLGLTDAASQGLSWAGVLTLPVPTPALALAPNSSTPDPGTPPPSPDWRFPNGTTMFNITADHASYPSDTRLVAVTFLHDSVYIVPGSVSEPNGVPCVSSGNSKLLRDFVVEFEVQGFQAADRALATWTTVLSGGTRNGAHVSHTTRGARHRVTLPEGTIVSTTLLDGTLTMSIVTNRTSALPVTGLLNSPRIYQVALAANAGQCP